MKQRCFPSSSDIAWFVPAVPHSACTCLYFGESTKYLVWYRTALLLLHKHGCEGMGLDEELQWALPTGQRPKNHRLAWVEKDLKHHLIQPHHHRQGCHLLD